jgi:polar amino acid transport system substrate-binding protein
MIRTVLAIAFGLFAFSGAAFGQDGLIIYYHDRPPYSARAADGRVQGITADIVNEAMSAAGVAYRWEELPSARQMEVIKRDQAPGCGLGWFKRPDREAFAKFSAAIYRDLPTIVVARAGDARFAGTPSIDALFADKSLSLLTKTGYSYGAEIDGKIVSQAPNARADASDNRIMLGMVSRERVDYMIMAEEEAKDLLAKPGIADAGLAIYHLANPPAGEYRYLMCSKSVPDDTIARINQALRQVP